MLRFARWLLVFWFPVMAACSAASDTAATNVAATTASPVQPYPHFFYKKSLSHQGFSLVASDKVPDQALLVMQQLIEKMTTHSPQYLQVLVHFPVKAAVIAESELLTELPDYADLPKEWDQRARGVGPTAERPTVSGAEENLLCYGRGRDRYFRESIFIHEFSHAIHFAISLIDAHTLSKITQAYNQAKLQGLWSKTYAIGNELEYFAEGTQSWFSANSVGPVGGNGVHNDINGPAAVRSYDPELAQILALIYGEDPWQFACP